MTTTAINKETLSGYIADHRKAMGLSFRQLGARAGIEHSYIARIESGRGIKKPAAAKLQQLADAFNVDVMELLRFVGVRPQPMRREGMNETTH